jgi:hypothetical protein
VGRAEEENSSMSSATTKTTSTLALIVESTACDSAFIEDHVGKFLAEFSSYNLPYNLYLDFDSSMMSRPKTLLVPLIDSLVEISA